MATNNKLKKTAANVKAASSSKSTSGINASSSTKAAPDIKTIPDIKTAPLTKATGNAVGIPSARQLQPEPVLFGALFKERRKKARLSQQELADMMNVTRNTVMNWEADKSKPDYSLLPIICTLLNIKVYELFHMPSENGLNSMENRIIANVRRLKPSSRRVIDKMVSTMADEELQEKDRSMKETFELFLVRPGTIAAGTSDYVPEEQPSYVFLRKNHINQKADGIVRVNGHSMEPVYLDGDDVYYKEATAASPGEDVIVDTDDGAVIKRVGPDHCLYSVNSDPRYTYPSKNGHNTLVIRGIVLGTVHSSDRATQEDGELLEELFVDEIREFNEAHRNGWEV